MYDRLKKDLDNTLKKYSIIERSKNEEKIETGGSNLSFVVWGDPQISRLSALRAARVYYAVEDIKNFDGKFDALCLAGDLTEYGEKDEYEMLSSLLSPISDKFDNIFAVPGNHDIRLKNYKNQVKRFSGFLKGLKNGVANPEDRYYFSKVIKGCKFIMLGADASAFEGTYLGGKQLLWLDRELITADRKKPVFVFNHQPLKNTNGLPLTFLGKGKWRGSVGWESDKLRNIFKKYNNVIYITGHLHYCTSEYTYEDCGAFKAVNVPTVGVINHGPFKRFTQGLIFNVFDDRIEVRSRVFGEGIYASEDVKNSSFTIDISNL